MRLDAARLRLKCNSIEKIIFSARVFVWVSVSVYLNPHNRAVWTWNPIIGVLCDVLALVLLRRGSVINSPPFSTSPL